MADLNKIVEDLSSLTVLEAAELSKLLEEKWGVSAAAPVAAVAAPAAAGGGAAAEEKTEFDVVLSAFDAKAKDAKLGQEIEYFQYQFPLIAGRQYEGP